MHLKYFRLPLSRTSCTKACIPASGTAPQRRGRRGLYGGLSFLPISASPTHCISSLNKNTLYTHSISPATMTSHDISPKPAPSLHLPQSDSTVEVSIINTTTDIVVPAKAFVQPVQKGHEHMNLPTFAFLVRNKKLGRTIMVSFSQASNSTSGSPNEHPQKA